MFSNKQQGLMLGLSFIIGAVLSAIYDPMIGLSVLIIANTVPPTIKYALKRHH